MKLKRRLLSLLAAVAVVCSILPVALADSATTMYVGQTGSLSSTYANTGWAYGFTWTSSDPTVVSVTSDNGYYVDGQYYGSGSATITARGVGTATITCVVSYYGEPLMGTLSNSWEITVAQGSGTSSGVGGSVSGYLTYLSAGALTLNKDAYSTLTISPASSYVQISSVTWQSWNESIVTVSPISSGTAAYLYGVAPGLTTVTATVQGYYYSATGYKPFTEYLGCNVTVPDSTSGTNNGYFYVSPNTLQLDVAETTVTTLTATPYTGSGLTSAQMANITWYSSDSSVVEVYGYVTGSGYTSTATGTTAYVRGVSAGTATVYARLTIGTQTYAYATCSVTVGAATSGATADVVYTLVKGQSQSLDAATFKSFWNDTYPLGALDYVVFGTSSGSVGSLVYNYRTSSGFSSQKASAMGVPFYANPALNQYGLNSVYFTPGTTASSYTTGVLSVPFTAYGTSSSYSGSSTTMTGTLYIVVTNNAVQAISYAPTGASVTLNPSDFVSVYKQAMNITSATTTPTVYIQFLDVPMYGELYYHYGSYNYTYGYAGTKLDGSNIGDYRFSSNSTGAYGIDDVSYVPGVSGDTIRYAAYSSATGGTLLYVGEINFTQSKAVDSDVKYYGSVGSTIAFNAQSFYDQLGSTSYYMTFTLPTTGTLYQKNAGGTYTAMTASHFVPLSGTYNGSADVNSICFVPAAGFTGVVEIPYTATTLLGATTRGTVKIYIAKSFTDVSANDWYYGYVTQLVAEGVVNGQTETTFAPRDNLKYGEALKMILEAAGYSEGAKLSGHWASGYLATAYANGFVNSTQIDLNAAIDRNTVAEITAKALRISPAVYVNSGITAPSDSTNGYVYALYNAGILTGSTENGVNVYKGSANILRSEVCAIICRICDYVK